MEYCLLIKETHSQTEISPQEDVQLQHSAHLMVKQQLEARGIHNQAILEAMRKIPRHLFVPSLYQNLAYADGALPIGQGQTISQPYIVAFMLQAARLHKKARVLEIGTGCGYQAAVLGQVCHQVFSVEIIDSLAVQARKILQKLNYSNITVRIGDGHKGWSEDAPFDAIFVTAASLEVPEALLEQLAEGGSLIIPIGESPYQYLMRYTKQKNAIISERLIPVTFVPMTGDKETREEILF